MPRPATALLAALVLLLGACGDGDDDADASGGDGTATTAAAPEESATDRDEQDGDEREDDEDGEDRDPLRTASDADPSEASEEFCDLAREFNEDPRLADDADVLLGAVRSLADEAPGDVADDLELMADQFGPLREAMATADEDDAELARAFEEYSAAGQRVGGYIEAACGVTLAGEGDPSTTDG
jgi:hypothetical protein